MANNERVAKLHTAFEFDENNYPLELIVPSTDALSQNLAANILTGGFLLPQLEDDPLNPGLERYRDVNGIFGPSGFIYFYDPVRDGGTWFMPDTTTVIVSFGMGQT